MDSPCVIHGLTMDCPWTVHGHYRSMDCPWRVHGLSWTLHGQSMDCPWTVHAPAPNTKSQGSEEIVYWSFINCCAFHQHNTYRNSDNGNHLRPPLPHLCWLFKHWTFNMRKSFNQTIVPRSCCRSFPQTTPTRGS